MGLPGCLFVCHLILLLMCFLFNYRMLPSFGCLFMMFSGLILGSLELTGISQDVMVRLFQSSKSASES